MKPAHRWLSAGLLGAFLGTHGLAAVCLFAMPPVATALSMSHCPMGMDEHDGPAIGADMSCCLKSVAETGRISSAFVSLESHAAIVVPVRPDAVFERIAPESVSDSIAPAPDTSPPVLLLTGSLLI